MAALRAAAVAAALLALGGAAPALRAAVEATDDAGQRIVLAQPAQRIVALAPHLAEQLFAIGAGDRIVATSDHADWPPAAQQIPRVARAHSVDLERVAAARPDLIVVWGSGYPPAIVESLKRLKLPVLVDEPGSLDSVAASLERLGRLTGSSSAPAAAAQYRQQIAALRAQYAGRAAVSVFYQVWAQPLMTLSGRHVVGEAIRLCGGRNVFEHLAPLAPQVSAEAVIAADPQVIVTAEPGGQPSAALDAWRRHPTLRAVRAGRLVTLDADRINRHGLRRAGEIALLCEHLDRARGAN